MLTILAISSISAQEKNTLRLSLTDARDYALKHNYTMQNAALDVQKNEVAKWETLTTLLPQGKLGFDYSNMCGYNINMSGMTIPMNPYGTLSLTASVAVTAQQIMGVILQNIAIDMSDINRKKTELATVSDVKNVYVSILVMEDIVGLLDSSLTNMLRLEQSTIESVKAGAAEQINADKLSVQVASLRNSINTQRRSLEMLYNALLLQLGADVNTNIELTTKLDEIFSIDDMAKMTLGGFHIEQNHDYQLLQQNAELSKKQILSAWLAFTPTISAYYQYSNKTYFGRDEGFNMTPPHMVGGTFSLPIFQSGTRIASIKKARIAYQETLNSKQQAEDGLRVQYNQLCYDLTSAIESYNIQKENITITKRVLDNTSEKYRYGRASSLEITNASTDLITAQSNYVQAVMNVITAQISLEKLLCE
ncbi:MAG: TolC family protein [Bacteroidales bacterium]|nr:TolC family protein [Candidatus Colimorpha onthohippi]